MNQCPIVKPLGTFVILSSNRKQNNGKNAESIRLLLRLIIMIRGLFHSALRLFGAAHRMVSSYQENTESRLETKGREWPVWPPPTLMTAVGL